MGGDPQPHRGVLRRRKLGTDRDRTIFVVGDTKQSIFGFQRADPRKLAEMRDRSQDKILFARKRLRAGRPHRLLPLDARVLDAVDWVFGQADAAERRRASRRGIHQHSRKDEPGRVELWPLVTAEDAETDTSASRRRAA